MSEKDPQERELWDYDELEKPLPKYQGNPKVVINGKEYYLNQLKNPFENSSQATDG